MNLQSKIVAKQIATEYWPGSAACYPFKTAYRPVELDFAAIWGGYQQVSLYYHIPFCRWKCSYCTLFSTVTTDETLIERYVKKMNEQLGFYEAFMQEKVVVKSIYLGGGTPNVLSERALETLMNRVYDSKKLIVDAGAEPCLEIAPEILTEQYLATLKKLGFTRISVGVQSSETSVRKAARRSEMLDLDSIFNAVRKHALNINIDLIYGLKYQTSESFMGDVENILKYKPESITLSPLWSPEVGILQKSDLMSMKERSKLYDLFSDLLIKHGYEEECNTRFLKSTNPSTYQQKVYEYGGEVPTLGIGCGARSYTKNVAYCNPFSPNQVKAGAIIRDYVEKDFDSFNWEGFVFTSDENKRRYLINHFYMHEVSRDSYKSIFETTIDEDFPRQLEVLMDNQLIYDEGHKLKLTAKGLKYIDIVATVFWSEQVIELMREAEKNLIKEI